MERFFLLLASVLLGASIGTFAVFVVLPLAGLGSHDAAAALGASCALISSSLLFLATRP